jgi:hypothetical protein
MKYKNFFTVMGLSMFIVLPVFAGNDTLVDSQLLNASLAKSSSSENAEAVALQQKAMFCEQNAKNKNLEGSNKENYVTTCMNNNEAMLAFAAIYNQKIASSNINEMLNQSPTSAGNK